MSSSSKQTKILHTRKWVCITCSEEEETLIDCKFLYCKCKTENVQSTVLKHRTVCFELSMNSLGFGQQTAYSPRGLRWHLCDDGQEDPLGPHNITSVEPIMSSGWPVWQGLFGCGRHMGTGGHGVSVHETYTKRHVSPSSRQEISEHGSRHLHV